MGKSTKHPVQLEGRFLGFVVKDGYKLKGMRLATSAGELYIKLTKEARASCRETLLPGAWLEVSGYQWLDYDDGTITYKAEAIAPSAPSTTTHLASSSASVRPEPSPVASDQLAKGCVLVCQKSDCCKRGARAVAAALHHAVSDRQLDGVSIKTTGCMKQCKAGPALVINKTRYTRVTPDDIPQLLHKHFPAAPQSS